MRDELGFRVEFVPKLGTMGQDMFEDGPGNALEAFYQKFAPLCLARELVGSREYGLSRHQGRGGGGDPAEDGAAGAERGGGGPWGEDVPASPGSELIA
jgi:hypothetical protein